MSFLHYTYEAHCNSYVLNKLNSHDNKSPESSVTRILLGACGTLQVELIHALLERGANPNLAFGSANITSWNTFLINMHKSNEKDRKNLENLYALTTRFIDASADPYAFCFAETNPEILPLETCLREKFESLGREVWSP